MRSPARNLDSALGSEWGGRHCRGAGGGRRCTAPSPDVTFRRAGRPFQRALDNAARREDRPWLRGFRPTCTSATSNIIKSCNRPFLSPEEQRQARLNPRSKQLHVSDETVEQHDAALIDAINALVGEDDELWVLGDFCWGEYAQANLYRRRIHCRRLHLVWGNHDDRSIRKCFSRVMDGGTIKVEGQRIWLQHSPQDHWEGRDEGAWHLFGDVHGALDVADAGRRGLRRKDVGVDASRYIPWSFRGLRAYFGARP